MVGDGSGGEIVKVGVNAVIGVSGMLTWASSLPSASSSSGSSFVKMADKFRRRGAISSGKGPSAVGSREDVDAWPWIPSRDRGWVSFSKK
jgi:hypothetical protein